MSYETYSTTCKECNKEFYYARKVRKGTVEAHKWVGRSRVTCSPHCRQLRISDKANKPILKKAPKRTPIMERRTKHTIVAEVFALLGVPMSGKYKPKVHGGVTLTTTGHEALLSAVKVLTEPIADPQVMLWEIASLLRDYNDATGSQLGLIDQPDE